MPIVSLASLTAFVKCFVCCNNQVALYWFALNLRKLVAPLSSMDMCIRAIGSFDQYPLTAFRVNGVKLCHSLSLSFSFIFNTFCQVQNQSYLALHSVKFCIFHFNIIIIISIRLSLNIESITLIIFYDAVIYIVIIILQRTRDRKVFL